MKKYICFLIVILFSIIKVNATPTELYDSTWKVLSENFYDKSMNHQDWNRWKTKYQNLATYEDTYTAINTMIESLDDAYTIFMQPSEYREEVLSMDGKTLQFGIYIRKLKNKCLLIPVKNGAAEKAGIKKNDILLEINGKSIKDMSADDFNTALDAIDNNSVEFTIKRKHSEDKTYKIVPAEQQDISMYDTPPYKKNKIPKNIKYYRIVSFMDRNLARQFQEIMENSDDKFDAYIIDLRGNSGGIAKNAAVMANMLLQDKEILSIVDRDGNKKVINANSDTLTKKPIIVLADRYSASASEIFVAALKDNNRAIIIGEKTFGKGVMQDVFKLPDNCGINITVKHYLTPSGNFINKKGIEPDIYVSMRKYDYIRKNDRVLKQALKYLKNNLKISR